MLNTSHTIFFLICTTTLICLSSSSSSSPSPPITQYTIMGPNLDKLPSPNEALQLFQAWMREHDRVYKDLDELARKFEIFLGTLKYITEDNASRPKSSTYLLGLNEFADWSREEFNRVYIHGYRHHDHSSHVNDHRHVSTVTEPQQPINVSAPIPAFIDWRAKGVVTSVKNQGNCGCCWAFSAIGAIEGITAIGTGRLINLSEQELLDCAVKPGTGCTTGRVNDGYNWVMLNGIATQADYPYTAVPATCRASQVPRSIATIASYAPTLNRTDAGLLAATIKQPISVAVNAIDFQYYIKDTIYDGRNCPNDASVNHGVLIVGYNSRNGEDYWIVKNSWGTNWGTNGYIYIKRNTGLPYGVCGINLWGSYPIRIPTPVSASSHQSVSSM